MERFRKRDLLNSIFQGELSVMNSKHHKWRKYFNTIFSSEFSLQIRFIMFNILKKIKKTEAIFISRVQIYCVVGFQEF